MDQMTASCRLALVTCGKVLKTQRVALGPRGRNNLGVAARRDSAMLPRSNRRIRQVESRRNGSDCRPDAKQLFHGCHSMRNALCIVNALCIELRARPAP